MRASLLVVLVAALLVGCSHSERALDGHARMACTYGFVGGAGQLQHDEVVEDRALLDAYGQAKQSANSVVLAWLEEHRSLGGSSHKSQAQADAALLKLLQVCRGLGWTPSSPTPSAR